MQLTELLHGENIVSCNGNLATEITAIACDSRKVIPGALFFALPGALADGHQYIDQAVNNGATALLVEDSSKTSNTVPWVQVPAGCGRKVMSHVASRFYGNSTDNLPLVGITGTNGKTTISYILEGILTAADIPSAVLGTISYRFGNHCIEASHTTPESIELHRQLNQLAALGAKGFVMEVSSHALEQHRVDGCRFDVAIFTNLTRDHLDYHGDMEQYKLAKMRLFSELMQPDEIKPVRHAVINLDDPAGEEFAKVAACPVISYGLHPQAMVTVQNLSLSVKGISATLVTPQGSAGFCSRLLGSYNLSNILAAAAAGHALGFTVETIVKGIENHLTVPGRLQEVPNQKQVTCLVDYAHTGDALQNVLHTLRALSTGRLITVFGCGGDRDPGKRSVMGEIAASYADLTIVTSDNPRSEDPLQIIGQIKDGIAPLGLHEYQQWEIAGGFIEKGFICLPDRHEAIRFAVSIAKPGDILLLAGKGHETYQISGREKHHFDDYEEAIKAFGELV